ncbi:MAG: hypothetical protein R3Y43_07395 [Alphaproteobacteria bacterium]
MANLILENASTVLRKGTTWSKEDISIVNSFLNHTKMVETSEGKDVARRLVSVVNAGGNNKLKKKAEKFSCAVQKKYGISI